MNKRDFLKASLMVGIASQIPLKSDAAVEVVSKKKKKIKNWIWIGPNPKDTVDELNTRYAAFKSSGVTGVFFEADSEKHFRAAKAQGLEAHRWMWTFNRAEQVSTHPEWYSKNRNGDSCADKPPYVNYYRWLCPSKPRYSNTLNNR